MHKRRQILESLQAQLKTLSIAEDNVHALGKSGEDYFAGKIVQGIKNILLS